MPFKSSVGRNGVNRKEDIARAQLLLSGVKASGRQPYWTGAIDGSMSTALVEALQRFQSDERLCRPTESSYGRLDTMSATMRKLEDMARRLSALQGVPGGVTQFAADGRSMGAATGPVPDDLAQAVQSVRQAARARGLGFDVVETSIALDGRPCVTLAPSGLRWADPRSGRMLSSGSPPEDLRRYLADLVTLPGIDVRTTNTSTGAFALQLSGAPIASLSGIRPLDEPGLRFFDLPAPTTAGCERLLGGAIELLSCGRAMTPAQAGELDRVISALHSLEPRAAEAVADRRDLITGEVTVESFRYLRRPDEEALRKVQSPLLFIDPSTADLSSMPFHQPSAEVLPGLFEMEFSFPPQYERGYVELEIEDSAESDNMPLDDFLFCVRNTFPELIFVGGIALAAEQPWIEKGRGSLEGASDRTSLVSKRLSKIKGWRFQKQVWAPTLKNPDAGTRNVGRFIARWIPYVGLAVVLLKVGMLAGCYAGRRMK